MARRGTADIRPDYEELVDWGERLAEEGPLIEEVLSSAPSRRVLDLGCGSGGHARFLAARGYEVVGIDTSEERLDRAEAAPPVTGPGGEPARLEYLLGDLGAVERMVRGHFGAALCLGDTLPHLLSPESLSRMMTGVRRRLLPGGPLLVHTLNYDRIHDRPERALPPLVRPGEQSEQVLLRLLGPRPDGFVRIATSLLRYDPRAEPPLEVLATHHAQVRGWRLQELETVLDIARFPEREAYGGFDRRPFEAASSPDLVLVAR